MYRIPLTKDEKMVLRWLRVHKGYKATMSCAVFDCALRSLQTKGLAFGYWSEESGLAVAGLTAAGEGYLEDNPRLRNPVDWKWVITTGVAALAALAAVVALLAACGGSWK